MKSKNLKKLALLGLTSGVLMSTDAQAVEGVSKGVEVSQLLASGCGNGPGGSCSGTSKTEIKSTSNASCSGSTNRNNGSCNGKTSSSCNGKTTSSCNGKRANAYVADNAVMDNKANVVVANGMSDEQALKNLEPLDRDVYKTMNDKQKALVRKLMNK